MMKCRSIWVRLCLILMFSMGAFAFTAPPAFERWLKTGLIVSVIAVFLSNFNLDITTGKKYLSWNGAKSWIASITAGALAIRFYYNWISSDGVRRIADLIRLNTSVFVAIVAVVLAVIWYFYFLHLLSVCFEAAPKQWETMLEPFSSRKERVDYFVISIVVILVCQSKLPLWGNTDNYWISCVLNGLYAEENYCFFLNPIIAYVVKAMGKILTSADCFVVLMECIITFAGGLFLWVFSRKCKKITYIIFTLSFVALNYITNLLHAPFTILSGFTTMIGIFMIFAWLHRETNLLGAVSGIALAVIGSLIRFEAFLLCIPFLLAIVLADFVNQEDKRLFLKRICGCMLPLLVMVLAAYSLMQSVTLDARYREAWEYNSHRSALVDFPTISFDDPSMAELEKSGISENDYRSVKNMILADTDIITTEYLENLNAISQKNEFDINYALSEIVNRYNFFMGDASLHSQLLLLLILGCAIRIQSRQKTAKFIVFGSFLTVVAISVYFTAKGHFPGYVFQTVLLYLWLVIAYYTVLMDAVHVPKSAFNLILGGAVLAAVLSGFLAPKRNTDFMFSLFAKNNNQIEIISYSDPDAVYIWDVYGFDGVIKESEYFGYGRLLSEDALQHNVVDGEWTYNQLYYREYLDRIGIPNPMRALVERDKTYYVAQKFRCELVLKFLREHYKPEIQVEMVDQTGEMTVWRFYTPENGASESA